MHPAVEPGAVSTLRLPEDPMAWLIVALVFIVFYLLTLLVIRWAGRED